MTMNGTNGNYDVVIMGLDQRIPSSNRWTCKDLKWTQSNQWSLIMDQGQMKLEWSLTKKWTRIMDDSESYEIRVRRPYTRAWDIIRVWGSPDQGRIPKLGFYFIKKPQLNHQWWAQCTSIKSYPQIRVWLLSHLKLQRNPNLTRCKHKAWNSWYMSSCIGPWLCRWN